MLRMTSSPPSAATRAKRAPFKFRTEWHRTSKRYASTSDTSASGPTFNAKNVIRMMSKTANMDPRAPSGIPPSSRTIFCGPCTTLRTLNEYGQPNLPPHRTYLSVQGIEPDADIAEQPKIMSLRIVILSKVITTTSTPIHSADCSRTMHHRAHLLSLRAISSSISMLSNLA